MVPATEDPRLPAGGNDRAARPQTRLLPVHPVRQLLGALLLPALSALVGRLFLHAVIADPFRRNVVGGCLVVLVKDLVAIAFEYGKLRQRIGRHIRSFVG